MGAAGILGVGFAAPFAQAAVGAELLTLGFYATAALFAQPGVILAAVDAMLTAAQAPLNIFAVAEAVVAFGAMATNAVLAQAALIAGRAGTSATVRTVLRVIINTLIAQLVFIATTIAGICVFAIDDQTNPAFLAGQLYAIRAMVHSLSTIALFSCIKAKMLVTVLTM